MAKFKITYTDPETEEEKTKLVEFYDFESPGEMTITAMDWAEDYGYALADKGNYTIKQLED